MKFRKDSNKGELMDERQIREEAWLEGVYAVTGLSPETALTVPNPYAPEVECTPTLQEMNAVLLSEFTQEEIWRGEKQREGQLAEHERVMIVEELERMKSSNGDWTTRDEIINDCVNAIKRLTG